MPKKTKTSRSFSAESSAVELSASGVVNPDAPSIDPAQSRHTAPAPDPSPAGSRERIAARAYELYLQRGGGHGRETEDWLEAEREISGRSSDSGSSSGR